MSNHNEQPPGPRPDVVALLSELAGRVVMHGTDAGGITWATRFSWSTGAERAAAYAWVTADATAAVAHYWAVADQQDASIRDDRHFSDQRWLRDIGVAPPLDDTAGA